MLDVMYKMLVDNKSLIQIFSVDSKVVNAIDGSYLGWRYATDVVDPQTGELLAGVHRRVQLEDKIKFKKHGVTVLEVFLTMNDEIEQCYWKSLTECKVAFIRELMGDVDLTLDNINMYCNMAIKEYEILQ